MKNERIPKVFPPISRYALAASVSPEAMILMFQTIGLLS